MAFIKKLKEQMLEGELIKRQTTQDQEADRKKELAHRATQAKMREDFRRANEDLKLYSAELKKKELEELKRLEQYAVKKERKEQLRKDKEEQKFAEKQTVR